MVLYSPDWTNTGFSFIFLTVDLFRHSTLTELGLYFNCLLDINYMAVSVLCLFLTVLSVGLKCVIVAFPGHTNFLFAHKVKPV